MNRIRYYFLRSAYSTCRVGTLHGNAFSHTGIPTHVAQYQPPPKRIERQPWCEYRRGGNRSTAGVHPRVNKNIHAYIHISIHILCICTYICIYTYRSAQAPRCRARACVYIYMYMYIYIYYR